MSESLAPAGTYHAVGFSYNQQAKVKKEEEKPCKEEPRVMVDQPQLIQHPPSSSVDVVEQTSDRYHTPKGLVVPDSIQTVSLSSDNLPTLYCPFSLHSLMQPCTWKLHQIIQRTAKFISQQGTQMEIIIKTKQQYNAHFSFLHYNDRLFPYYKHLLRALVNKEYEPEEEEESETKEEANNTDSSNDSEEEEEEAYELHPLLRGSASAAKTNSVTISSPLLAARKKAGTSKGVNSIPPLASEIPDYLYAQPR